MSLLILPHQLFSIKEISKYNVKNVVIYEHPWYFTRLKYNKKKLVLHRASMKYYQDYLSKYTKVKYVEYDKPLPETDYVINPIDNIGIKYNIESPNVLLSNQDIVDYRRKTDKFRFHNFFNYFKEKLKLKLPASTDKQNRKKMTKKDIEDLNSIPRLKPTTNKYINEAKTYVNKNFPNNYGVVDNFEYPVTHKDAENWMNHFFKYKLKKFGDFQDFIISDTSVSLLHPSNSVYHSLLSTSLNIGLLSPYTLLEKAMKSNVAINNKEGYIRQLFWREYQRFCYVYADFSYGKSGKKPPYYYKNTLMDHTTKKLIASGYLHHIERLMILANYFHLSGYDPNKTLEWFLELSCDAYEWVMTQNVLSMGFNIGNTMTRVYISSSNYIINMSNLKKGDWSIDWDKKYHKFIS